MASGLVNDADDREPAALQLGEALGELEGGGAVEPRGRLVYMKGGYREGRGSVGGVTSPQVRGCNRSTS